MTGSPQRGTGEHVLVVDDEPGLLRAIAGLLRHLGYQVTTTDDGAAALAWLTASPHEFDLVLTDQTMPAMTGADLAQQVRARRPELPIVMMTGFSDLVGQDTAQRIGCREMMAKPITMRVLADTMRRALSPLE